MATVSKKRQTQLLTLYATVEEIGTALVLDFIEQRKAENGLDYERKLNDDEVEFLGQFVAENIHNEEDRAIYNSYVRLIQALVRLINAVRLSVQIFKHGHYKATYTLQGKTIDAFMEKFKSLTSYQELKKEASVLQKYISSLENIRESEEENKALEEDLMFSWNYSCLAILTLSYEDFMMSEIEEISKFELKDIRPQMQQMEKDFFQVQFLAKETEKILTEHYKNKKGSERFNQTKLSKTLKAIQKASITDFIIKDEAKNVIKEVINNSGINADVVNHILGIIDQRALIYDTK